MLAMTAIEQLRRRVKRHFDEASHVRTILEGIPFMDDLEAAIRRAWTPGYTDGPFREPLVMLFFGLQPYLHKHDSSSKLLEELPQFSVDLAKAGISFYEVEKIFNPCLTCDGRVKIRPATEVPEHPNTLWCLTGDRGYLFCNDCAQASVACVRRLVPGFHSDCRECSRG